MIVCPHHCGEYREDLGILICRPAGTLTSDTLADIAICRDCIEKAGLNHVNRFHDLRGIISVNITFSEMFGFIQRESVNYSADMPIKACYLVPNAALYGTIRMYEALIAGRGVNVYVSYDINELAAILGVDVSRLQE